MVNAKVFTSDQRGRYAEALAVERGSFVAVGSNEEIRAASMPDADVIDAGGALVTPGFIDAHVHTAMSGLEQLRLNFDDCANADDAYTAIATYVADHPDATWILGGGWSQAWFDKGCPDAATLDSIVGDRPALIANTDGHGVWVNSAALSLAGIDRSTPDPADGRIERLADGSPQGTLHEGARSLVQRHAPPDTAADFRRGLIRGQAEMHRYGITGWQEAIVHPEIQDAYLAVAWAGQLEGDVVGAMWWDRHRGMEQIEELVERRSRSAPGFRPTSVKLMLDGVAENFTASVLDPYLDDTGAPTENRGVDFIDASELKEIVVALDRLGFQCHFHALGDRAVRNALDALQEALQRNGLGDNRHHLAHIQFVHPTDIPRFGELGAIANAQPLWACNDDYQLELTKPFISPERYSWQYPFGSILRGGGRLGMGSDWNVSTANVMAEIDVAVTRSDGGGEPLGPDEALSPEQALMAFTSGSAFINHSEHRMGSIEVGKQADFVMFDRNPLVEGPLRDAQVVATFRCGRPVYQV